MVRHSKYNVYLFNVNYSKGNNSYNGSINS